MVNYIFYFRNASDIKTGKGRAKKYVTIDHNYESKTMPGVFVAGTASHSLDWRKSAGGFIHGFRYTGIVFDGLHVFYILYLLNYINFFGPKLTNKAVSLSLPH